MRISSNGIERGSAPFEFTFAGQPITAHAGESLAAALMAGGIAVFRTTHTAAKRGPFCGMGVCGGPGSSSGGGGEQAAPRGDDGCGACADLQLVLDPRTPRGAGSSDVSGAALPVEPTPDRRAVRAPGFAPRADRGREPPHLIRLRSVLLRC
jgi:hypothetical protein